MGEEWSKELEQVYADLQDEQAALQGIESALAAVTFTADDQCGLLSVTADGRGVVVAVRFRDEQFRIAPATELGQLLTLTIAQARQGALARAVLEEPAAPE